MRTAYRVKEECIDRFYGSTDPEVIRDYQTNGIPAEDLDFLTAEWGDITEMLEEI